MTPGSSTTEEGTPFAGSPPTPLLSSILPSPFPVSPFAFPLFPCIGMTAFYNLSSLGLSSWLPEPGLADLRQCHSLWLVVEAKCNTCEMTW